MIKECFSPIPILTAELFSQEIVGVDLLNKLAEEVYGKKDPSQIFFTQKPISIEKTDGGFDLSLHLPFVKKKDLDLYQKGEDLFVRVGSYKRNILLPQTLLNHSIKDAKFDKDMLKISFIGVRPQ